MTRPPRMPKQISVHRAGTALWLEIDGWATPVDWVDAAVVAIGAADGPDQVTLTLYADHITVEAEDIDADAHQVLEVDDDGETQEGPAPQTPVECVRVPG